MTFYPSEHERAMRRYEEARALAKQRSSDFLRLRTVWQQIEDDLVAGGRAEIERYRAETERLARSARSLPQWDGIGDRREIMRRAIVKLDALEKIGAEE